MPRNLNDFDDYLNKKKKSSVDFELNLKTFGTKKTKTEKKKEIKLEPKITTNNIETIDVEERDKKGSILKKMKLMFKNTNTHNKKNLNKTNQEIDEIKLYDDYEKVFEDTKILLKKIFSSMDKKELIKLRKTKEFNELAEIYFDQW